MASGTTAALVPMVVPASSRVSGMRRTIRMMNGVERAALTIVPKILLTILFSRMCPFPLTSMTTPSGTPKAKASRLETPTM